MVSSANVRHSLEDHAVTLAVKGLDVHHAPGHYSGHWSNLRYILLA